MATKIRLLTEDVANKIAAGEVVERPASVMKELVENSLDAGACRILVDVRVGGRKSIRVIDDGEGMSPDDALLALERHATSKIITETDLFSVATMGFRGEALPAIASVSRFTLRTALHGAASGTRIAVEGGLVREAVEEAVAPGTEIEANDLFFNTPGRRKFLRSPETELTHVVEMFTRLALPREGVFFRLRDESKTLLQVSETASLAERIATLLGPDAARGLVDIDWQGSFFRLRGYVSGPEITRSSAGHMFVYCNGRFLRDRLITHSINTGYKGHILKGRYPVVVLMIEIEPELVDVNVHPTKSEVRFRQPSGVYEGIVGAIDETLRKRFGAPDAAFFPPPPQVPPATSRQQAHDESSADGRQRVESALLRFNESAAPRLFERPAPPATREIEIETRRFEKDGTDSDGADKIEFQGAGIFSRLSIVGQIFNNYIVCETLEHKGQMVLIDAHAAHERILFEKLKAEYRKSSIPVQGQLVPVTLELRRAEAAALRKSLTALARVGIEVEPFGGETFRIVAVPSILSAGEAAAVVRECIERYLETGQNAPLDHVADGFLSVLACHSAVRSGQELTLAQMREILKGLDLIEGSASCPHGRPTVWSVSLYEIEKRFKRR